MFQGKEKILTCFSLEYKSIYISQFFGNSTLDSFSMCTLWFIVACLLFTCLFFIIHNLPSQSTAVPATTVSSKKLSQETMGEPQAKFGDSEVLLVHLDTNRLVGCPVSERRQLLSGRNKRKVLLQKEVHQGQSFTVTRASEEQAKAAGVVQLMEGTMRGFVQR